MDYLLKASAILVLFYACYFIFLQRETFFVSNRWFLILGLVTAVIFQMLVIPIYVEVTTTSLDGYTMMVTSGQNIPEPYDWTLLIHWIYGIGASFFFGRLIIQLISLVALIKKNDTKKIGHFTFVETNQNTTPFSFFNWIVYNPKQFNSKELELILKHEKVHAIQMHSLDVLLIDLATALFWFNPFIWLYRKALKQNLEFIADRETQKQTGCEERYQKLLLKTSLPQQNLTLINTFYNSSIRLKISGTQIVLFNSFGQVKKRIVMLHKSKSNLMNTWKYSIVVPLLAIFAMIFNTETIAQTRVDPIENTKNDQQNILKFVVTKDTKDKQLDFIKNKIFENGASITFKNIKRNTKNEIIGIKIAYNHENTKLVHSKKLSEPIKPIEISMNPSDGKIDMSEQISSVNQTFNIETNDEGQKIILEPTNKPKENSFRIIGNRINKNATNKDTIFIENITEKVSYKKTIDENNKMTPVKKTNSETRVFKNDETSPLVLFDGKEINNEEMNAIDPKSINNIHVLKDKAATKKYGKKGENGVILITSKKNAKTEDQQIIFENKNNQKIIRSEVDEDIATIYEKPSNLLSNSMNPPLYIVDGKETTREQMDAINQENIASVFVLKGEQATKEYGKKGKNGVIILTTKKNNYDLSPSTKPKFNFQFGLCLN